MNSTDLSLPESEDEFARRVDELGDVIDSKRLTVSAIEGVGWSRAGAVGVTVRADGSVVSVELKEETARMSRRELGQLVADAVNNAQQNAADNIAAEMKDLVAIQRQLIGKLGVLAPRTAAVIERATYQHPESRNTVARKDRHYGR